MRKSLLALLLMLSMTVFSQSPFKGFFKKIDRSLFEYEEYDSEGKRIASAPSIWTIRPMLEVTAMQFIFTNPVTVKSFTSFGTGVTLAHFAKVNDEPYMDRAFNLLVLWGAKIGDVSPAEISLAGTITAWQYINFGAGYNFSIKKPFLLTGVNYNFNF